MKNNIMQNKILLGFIIAAVPFIIYFNSFNNDFLAGDDEDIVLRNTYLKSWHYIPKFFTQNYKAGSGTISNFWRPFQVLTYGLIVPVFGVKPLMFHIASIFFHCLAGIFLYLLLLKLFPQKIPAAIMALAVLAWVAHPMHNEELSVTTGIASPTYLFWMLFGLLSFLYYQEKKKIAWFIASLAGFVLSLCSKESSIIFPVLLLGMHMAGIKAGVFKKMKPAGFIRTHVLFWIIAFGYVAARLTVLNFQDSLNFYSRPNVFTENFLYRAWTLFTVLAHGLRIMVFPAGLHPERSWPVFTNFLSKEVLLAALIIAAMIYSAVISWKKNPLFSFGIFWFFVCYFPMSNLAAKINAIVWDHWFYAPSVGIVLCIVSLAKEKFMQKLIFIVLIPAVIIFSALTITRNNFWKNTESTSRFILEHEPKSAKTMNNLAMALAEKGNIQEASEYYRKAISMEDVYPQTHHNLANIYRSRGEYDLAQSEYLIALSMDSTFYHSYIGLGNVYLLKGRNKEAAAYYRKALEIYPYLPQVQELLTRIEE